MNDKTKGYAKLGAAMSQFIIDRLRSVPHMNVNYACRSASIYQRHIMCASELKKLVAECFGYLPNDRVYVLNTVREYFPEMSEEISKLEILL